MQSEIAQAYTYLGYALLAGFAMFVLRIILMIALRKRFAPGLVPGMAEVNRPDSGSRLVALIGQGALVQRTLGTSRLPATFGLKALIWGVLGLMVCAAVQMGALLLGFETLLLLLVLYLALHTSLYEITYDRDTITLPRWWFGRSTRKWRDLDAVVARQGWHLDFHFRDGTVIQAHKYVVGYAELREAADKVLREV
jgi:hypothetical protein